MTEPLTDEQITDALRDAAKVQDRAFCADAHHRALSSHVEALAAELAEYRKAATFWQGPQECLERECEDYFDDAGSERPGIERCSHVEVKTLTPEQVNATLGKLADDDGLVWDEPEAAQARAGAEESR